jgi:RNA polymerase sigma-70 factor (ECF subfamily)
VSAQTLTDADLVARCRAGEREAWNALVERFSRYVYAIATQAYRLSHEDAEDVFQDVFSRTYEHLGRLRSDEAIRPWIGQLTRRLCVDRLRAARRVELEASAEEVEAFDLRLEQIEDALTVREALAQLSDDCQEILDRFFCRDQSYREIGDEVGIPAGTIASRISRCLGKLRERLEGRFEGSAPSSSR